MLIEKRRLDLHVPWLLQDIRITKFILVVSIHVTAKTMLNIVENKVVNTSFGRYCSYVASKKIVTFYDKYLLPWRKFVRLYQTPQTIFLTHWRLLKQRIILLIRGKPERKLRQIFSKMILATADRKSGILNERIWKEDKLQGAEDAGRNRKMGSFAYRLQALMYRIDKPLWWRPTFIFVQTSHVSADYRHGQIWNGHKWFMPKHQCQMKTFVGLRRYVGLKSELLHLAIETPNERVGIYRCKARAVIKDMCVCVWVGGGVNIHIFVFCPTNFFWNQLYFKRNQSVKTWAYRYSPHCQLTL